MSSTIVTYGQTIWDIAIEKYGSVEGVFKILDQNPELHSLNANPYPGMVLKTPGYPNDKSIAEYFDKNRKSVVSHPDDTFDFTDDFSCDFDTGETC